MDDVQELIELPSYDGWSVAVMNDGTYMNRWKPGVFPRRYVAAQAWIETAPTTEAK